MTIRVQRHEIDFSSPQHATIDNAGLAGEVSNKNSKVVDLLGVVAPSLTSDQISVDSSGKVIVKNAEFVTEMQKTLQKILHHV